MSFLGMGSSGIVAEVEMYQGRNKKWRWRVKDHSAVPEILASSEEYSSKAKCLKTAAAMACQLDVKLNTGPEKAAKRLDLKSRAKAARKLKGSK